MNSLSRSQVFLRSGFSSVRQNKQFIRTFSIQLRKNSNLCKRVSTFDQNSFHVRNVSVYSTKSGFGSKYHPMSPLETTELRLREVFFDKASFTTEEWTELKNQLFVDFLNLSELNFDSVLMNSMLALNNIELARSFMRYLNETCTKPNLVTCLKYMVLCSQHLDVCKQDIILGTFERIKSQIDSSPILDVMTVDCIVRGLCATDQWNDSFNYIRKLALNNPKYETKNALIAAAFRHGEESRAWKIMTGWYRASEAPDSKVIKEYFNFVSNLAHKEPQFADRDVEKFFLFLQKKNAVIKADAAKHITNYFNGQKHNWLVKDTKINKLGVCNSCQNSLENLKLTHEEFQQLQEVFFNRVVKKSDVFINYTAAELNNFIAYINRNKPFDIVLDGLNAAHSVIDLKIRRTLAKQLLEVVKRLTVASQRVLILGRKHMYRWPRPIMDAIEKRASIFFASNSSEDDPLVIYAALASGPDTLFVSSDLMRDHIGRLDDPVTIKLFQKWQQSHQIYLSSTEQGPMFHGPLKHHISIQGNLKSGWHIPYDDEFILDPYEELNNWLCIQRIR